MSNQSQFVLFYICIQHFVYCSYYFASYAQGESHAAGKPRDRCVVAMAELRGKVSYYNNGNTWIVAVKNKEKNIYSESRFGCSM